MEKLRSAEKIAVTKVTEEYLAEEKATPEGNDFPIDHYIEMAIYENHELFIYDLFELIESKNENCTREQAQRIAGLLIEDMHLSDYLFMIDCLSGKIDR